MEGSIGVKKVIVWRFETVQARLQRNISVATRVGEASSWDDLRNIASGAGYYGYTDSDSDQWMSYADVGKLFGQEPWVSM